jgi:hypothetical protein
VAFLRFQRQSRDRPRIEPLERDRLAGLFAETVGAVLQPGQGRVDLARQLALTVAGAQLNRFMNERQREYFRRKLLNWKSEILREAQGTLTALQSENAIVLSSRSLPVSGDRRRGYNRAGQALQRADAALHRLA